MYSDFYSANRSGGSGSLDDLDLVVDRGHALDDLTVGRNQVAGFDQHQIAGLQIECRDLAPVAAAGGGTARSTGRPGACPRRRSA